MRDETLRYWLADVPVEFRVGDERLEPVSVQNAGGWVEFNRCLTGLVVQACGLCRPLSLAGRAEGWSVELSSVAEDTSGLGYGDDRVTSAVVGGGGLVLDGFRLASDFAPLNGGKLVASLPSGAGALFAAGMLAGSIGSQVRIRLEKGSVAYAR